jgi:hypothetical protein
MQGFAFKGRLNFLGLSVGADIVLHPIKVSFHSYRITRCCVLFSKWQFKFALDLPIMRYGGFLFQRSKTDSSKGPFVKLLGEVCVFYFAGTICCVIIWFQPTAGRFTLQMSGYLKLWSILELEAMVELDSKFFKLDIKADFFRVCHFFLFVFVLYYDNSDFLLRC